MKVLSKATLAALALALSPAWGEAQQRPLEHEDMARWARIVNPVLSQGGDYATYGLTWMDSDPRAVVRNLADGSEGVFERGTAPQFSPDGRFILVRVKPAEAVVDSLKEAGTDGDDLPGDTLVVGSLVRVAAEGPTALSHYSPLKSVLVPEEEGSWIAIHLDEEPSEDESTEDEGEDEEERDGTTLILRHLDSGEEVMVDHVTDAHLAENGTVVVYVVSGEGDEGDQVHVRRLGREGSTVLAQGGDSYTELATTTDGSAVAFLAGTTTGEDEEEETTYVLMASWDLETANVVAEAGNPGLPQGWLVSPDRTPRFSEGGDRLFFGSAPKPMESVLDDVPEDEQVELDIWNWKDPLLQPMQLVRQDDEEERNYLAIYRRDNGSVLQVGSPDLPEISLTESGDSRFALGRSGVPYFQEISWDGFYTDGYSVSLETGEATQVVERVRYTPRLSPEGRYAYWWDGEERQWYVATLANGEVRVLSDGIPEALYNELDDHPQTPPPYGGVVWVENDQGVLLYDKHDIWLVDPAGRERARNITEGMGRSENLRFRVARTTEQPSVPNDRILLSAFDLTTKDAGFYHDDLGSNGRPTQIVMDGYSFSTPQASEDGETLLFTRESFTDFPNLWTADADLGNREQISDVNPQQAEYAWGTAELVDWTSADGETLEGILYKPDGFDPSETYPMMVYFYERNSNTLNRHRAPAPGSSSINFSFYVSRGYVLFVPDIPYEIGYPGESALDAVVPGVLSIVDQGYIDRDKIGVQGHSWGGYQIAYMITKTNLFAAAEAGAPVSNMTSAYGGIRWASGMSRAFQYERTQSRIGGTLWEATDEYLHNSPVFYADKIHTPLLMMHNDEDGAVPWYQGIEMFVAMRRLGKPVWMLNYNGEAHGLRQEHNRQDWAIRMQQFFDHYLMDAPAPVWLEDGVPAINKGKTLGLELKRGPIS